MKTIKTLFQLYCWNDTSWLSLWKSIFYFNIPHKIFQIRALNNHCSGQTDKKVFLSTLTFTSQCNLFLANKLVYCQVGELVAFNYPSYHNFPVKLADVNGKQKRGLTPQHCFHRKKITILVCGLCRIVFTDICSTTKVFCSETISHEIKCICFWALHFSPAYT